MSRRISALGALSLLIVVALAGCTPATVGPTATPLASASASVAPLLSVELNTAAHLVTQEGLAIALASNVLQSQLLLVGDAVGDDPVDGCTPIAGGGAHVVTGRSGDYDNSAFTDTIFFDAGCAQPYMVLLSTVQQVDDTVSAQATVTYTGTSGAALGTMATTASAVITEVGVNVQGVGTFTRADASPVSLGLACQSISETALDCQGGVAQHFDSLDTSLGSITPLHLTLGDDPTTQPLPFQGSGNSVASGPDLAITSDGANLGLIGAVAGDAVPAGQAGSFSLFPPPPTGWTVTSASGDVSFTIAVVDDATRTLTGSVVQVSTGVVLATIAVDRSGTGTITYEGAEPVAISSWMLGD